MKKIKLTQNKYALVDDKDFDFLNQFTWHWDKKSYARTAIKKDKKWIKISMHRIIMKAPEKTFIDHIDHNPLNNQKTNLRFATVAQNGMNRVKEKSRKCSSKFKGVSLNAKLKKWKSRIGNTHLGYFNSELEAAKAYDNEAKIQYGEFANLNLCKSKNHANIT